MTTNPSQIAHRSPLRNTPTFCLPMNITQILSQPPRYGSIILKISSQLVGEIVGKNGVVIQSIKSAREASLPS